MILYSDVGPWDMTDFGAFGRAALFLMAAASVVGALIAVVKLGKEIRETMVMDGQVVPTTAFAYTRLTTT